MPFFDQPVTPAMPGRPAFEHQVVRNGPPRSRSPTASFSSLLNITTDPRQCSRTPSGHPFDESNHHDRDGIGRGVRNGSDHRLRNRRAAGIPARIPRLRTGRSISCHGRKQHRSGQSRARALRVAWIGAAIATALTEAVGLGRRGLSSCLAFSSPYRPPVLESGARYPRVVGPFYGILGLVLFLVFRLAAAAKEIGRNVTGVRRDGIGFRKTAASVRPRRLRVRFVRAIATDGLWPISDVLGPTIWR